MSLELFVLLSLGGCIALWGAQQLRLWWGNQHQQVQALTATLLEKAQRQETGSGWDPDQSYVLTFLLPDGSQQAFTVTHAQYQQALPGASGTLYHRGTWFRGFEPLS